MKQYRVITSAQSIASFMVGFEKDQMTYEEYNEWSNYLENALTKDNYEAKVFYGKQYLDELEKAEGGYLFSFGDKSIKIAQGKTIDDLDQEVLAYMDVDTILSILDAVEAYPNEKENGGLVQ